jgi:hypothetical protein
MQSDPGSGSEIRYPEKIIPDPQHWYAVYVNSRTWSELAYTHLHLL